MNRRELTEAEIRASRKLKSAYAIKKAATQVTQETLAASLGWSQGALGQYLNGKTPLNLEALLKICVALDVTPDTIYPELILGLNLDVFELEKYTKDATPLDIKIFKQVLKLNQESKMAVYGIVKSMSVTPPSKRTNKDL